MKQRVFAILMIFHLTLTGVSAQKNKMKFIKWDKDGVLPLTNGKLLGVAGPVAGVSNGVLIVGGGANFPGNMPWLGGTKHYYDDLHVYKKDDSDSLVLFKSFKLPIALAYPANVSTGRGIVVAGGENESGISKKVFLIKWNEPSQTVSIEPLPDLPVSVTNAAAVVYGNTVYLAGGEMTNDVSAYFLCLNLDDASSGWSNLPSLPNPASHAIMVVQSNRQNDYIYFIGGRKKNQPVSDFYSSNWQFDLKVHKWVEKSPLPFGLSAGTGIAVGRDAIILFGGDNGATFHKTEELIFAIKNEKDEIKKGLLNEEKIKIQSMHPGFCKGILLYETEKDRWRKAGHIPFDAPVTTTAIQWNDRVYIPGGEVRAGVRTPLILSAKIF